METNYFIEGEASAAIKLLDVASVDLIYADPPFNTGRDFDSEHGGYSDKADKSKQVVLPPGFHWLREVTTPSELVYFSEMLPILLDIHRVLKKTGALYWHMDWRTSPVYRLLLNQIFGTPQFRNEIIWHYNTQMPYDTIKKRWKNNCDYILFYAKKDHAFNPQFYPLSYKEIKAKFPYTDSEGRKYRHREGLYSERIYADSNRGQRIGTCWTDIDVIRNPKERTGYAYQKPLALLRRIIEASSNESDLVLDPFCGSGTTCVAADELNRNYIGIDRNPEAIYIAKERLK